MRLKFMNSTTLTNIKIEEVMMRVGRPCSREASHTVIWEMSCLCLVTSNTDVLVDPTGPFQCIYLRETGPDP